MQKKKLWAGVVHGQIEFFNQNPDGSVDGLQGYRPFTINNNCELTDDNGGNIVSNTETGAGANTSDVSEHTIQGSSPTQTA